MRIGVLGEFVGHGLLAIGGKKEWIGWINQLLHTDPSLSANLLLLVGLTDVAVALITLVKPIRPLLLWAAFWGFWTALVRPLVGLSFLDFIERSANFATPLALFFYYREEESKEQRQAG